jgi:hypothetical protein
VSANRGLGGALGIATVALVMGSSPALAATPSTAGAPTELAAGITPHTLARVQVLAGALKVIRTCEASGNYAADTGNGFYGAYQFSVATWHSLGLKGLPHRAPHVLQDAAAVRLHDGRHSWTDWGACGRKAAEAHA